MSLGVSTWLAERLQRWRPLGYVDHSNNLIYLPTPEQSRLMALGFNQVVADYYWVRGLQYFTEPTFASVQYRNLSDFLELVVSLDPQFEYAYKFAGIATPYDMGRNRVVNTERSTSFLERGVKLFPNNWELRFFLGFNYLNYHQQPQKAAEQFALASKIPGSPPYLAAFAARVYTLGGELERAIAFAEATLASTTDPEIQNRVRQRLIDLHAEKELRRIESGAQSFREQMGRFPLDLEELVRTGFPPPQVPGFRLNSTGEAQLPDAVKKMILNVPPSERGLGVLSP